MIITIYDFHRLVLGLKLLLEPTLANLGPSATSTYDAAKIRNLQIHIPYNFSVEVKNEKEERLTIFSI